MGKHAILGASSSNRWLHCTPSARLEASYPDESSSFAAEGTLAHSLAELELRKRFKGLELKDYLCELARVKSDELFQPEMVEHVASYIALVEGEYNRLIAADDEVSVFVEYKVDFSNFAPSGFGTADCVLCSPSEYVIIDFKYGMGVPVEAHNNPQLKLYALGIIEEQELAWGPNPATCIICQPRLDSITSCQYDYTSLKDWGAAIKPIALAAYEGKGELVMGPWCKFCKHKRNCQKQMEEAFAVVELPAPTDLTSEQLVEVLNKKDQITDYLKSLEQWALERVRDLGEKLPGYKLVASRTMRKYGDQDRVAEVLMGAGHGTEIYKKPELLGIGDMEKLLGKDNFKSLIGDLIVKPEGQPTLVPESDKRAELTNIKDVFSEVKINE